MSFLTPPPDFDDCGDAAAATAAMLNKNTCLPDIFYPSPSASQTGCTTASYSPHASSPRQHEQSYLDHIDDQHQHQAIFTNDPTSLDFDSTDHSIQAYAMEVPFTMYEQSTWPTYPAMTNQYSTMSSGHDDTTYYPSYSTESSLPANIIPVTPQPVTPAQYSFNNTLRIHEPSHYPPLSMRQTYTPDTTRSHSMSVCSRSCSPNPPQSSTTTQSMHRRQSSTRSNSVASASSPLSHYGIPVRTPGASANSAPQAWRCAYPNCSSRATFIRGCDLRKHYNRHSKHLFCRVDGCPQSETAAITAAQAADPHCKDPSDLILSGGFSSKKDRARHEAKHNPGIKCEWHGPDGEGCGRVFSRMDNMKDHVRRIHQKGQTSSEMIADRSRKLKRSR